MVLLRKQPIELKRYNKHKWKVIRNELSDETWDTKVARI